MAIQKNRILCCIAIGIIVVFQNFLSVHTLRCHQCNSHLNEDCVDLRLRTPRAPLDDQFLSECKGDYADNATPFCRKTVVYIAVNEENRIVRSCGWLHETFATKNDTCFDADNEGFMQTICTCDKDGCNAASDLFHMTYTKLFTMAIGLVICTYILKR